MRIASRFVALTLSAAALSATAGPLNPTLTGVRQRIFRPSAGNVSTIPVSFQTPRRSLPRHSGQSSATRRRTSKCAADGARR